MKVSMQNARSAEEFNIYSGTNVDNAIVFLNKVADKIPEFKHFNFKLFYSGYAGFTINNGDDKIGYLMYSKNTYGLEDCRTGRGWYLSSIKGKTDARTWKRWEDAVNVLSAKDPSKPRPARMG